MSKSSTRDKKVQQVIVIEGVANVVVLLIKTVVGFSTGSLAVLGDAIHSLTDVMNNIVAWLVLRVSAKPADDEHPYGHRKFETITVFGLASLLVVFAIELALHAIRHEPVAVYSENWELALMLLVLAFNIGLATWENYWAKKLDSDILKADAIHTFTDVLTTVVVIVGWQLSVMGYIWVDRLCALGVSFLVFAIKIIVRSWK
ncbi:MAG: cation diffusion facilitator family transporter [Proteobacteria bacterium]|nr:cation diffusion facilitator family transporter [Pseudomonadota bacterium]